MLYMFNLQSLKIRSAKTVQHTKLFYTKRFTRIYIIF